MFEKLKELACKHFGVTKEQLNKSNRKREVVYANSAIINVLHKKGYSVYEISDAVGKSRPTVLHHLRIFDDKLSYDYDFRNMYNEFIKEVER